MRGLSYSEGMTLSWEDREIVGEIIKENLETTKKTGLNLFQLRYALLYAYNASFSGGVGV